MISYKYHVLIIAVFSIIFIGLYSFLTTISPLNFTSPDENVNLFFSRLYSQTGKLSYYEPHSDLAEGYLRPRNSVAKDGFVSNSGFAGLPVVYGALGTLITIQYITPVISLLGVLFIYLLATQVFNRNIGLISAALVLVSSPYWFWSSMTMFNNLPATVFFIGGVCFMLKGLMNPKLGYYAASALMFGINQFFRFTDIIYFLPLLIVLFFFRKEINFKFLFVAGFIYLASVLPVFLINNQLYGSFLSFGYSESTTQSVSADLASSILNRIKFFLLPSGIHPDKMAQNFFIYLVQYTPITFIITALSIAASLFSGKDKLVRIYIYFYLALSLWILTYYGSGVFWGVENFTMDASYIRYFLPIYILSAPITAYFIMILPKKIAVLAIFIFITSSTLNSHFSNSGLEDMSLRRASGELATRKFLSGTDKNSIIFTTLSDKNIFPSRKVVVYGPGYNKLTFNYPTMAKLITNMYHTNRVVYVYNDRNDVDTGQLNQLIAGDNLRLYPSDAITNLYIVKNINEK